MLYLKRFIEEKNNEDIIVAKDKEAKYVKKLIKNLKVDKHSNKETRAEFAKIMFQICLSSDPYARKFIKKISDFVSFWEDDEMITEDEWHRLNNSNA